MQYIKREKQLDDGTRVCFDLQNLDELEQILTSEREKIKKGNQANENYKTVGAIMVGVGALLLIISFCIACKLMDNFKYGALLMYMSGIIMAVGFVLYLVSYKLNYKSPWQYEIEICESKYRCGGYEFTKAMKNVNWDKDVVLCGYGTAIRYIDLSCEYRWVTLPNENMHYWDKDYIEIRGYLNKNKHRYVCDIWEPLKTHSSLDRFMTSTSKTIDAGIEKDEER